MIDVLVQAYLNKNGIEVTIEPSRQALGSALTFVKKNGSIRMWVGIEANSTDVAKLARLALRLVSRAEAWSAIWIGVKTDGVYIQFREEKEILV